MNITTPGTVLKNTTVQGDLNIEGAHGSRIENVIVNGSFSNQNSNDVVHDHMTVNGRSFNVNKWTLGHSKGNQFLYCKAPYLGRGQMTGDHCFLMWNADKLVMVGNEWDCTVEDGVTGDQKEGPMWWFDCPNGIYQDNTSRIHIRKADGCYAIWRWRADVHAQIGCYNNRFLREKVYVDGTGGKILPTSSGTCDGSHAGCWGLWDSTFDECVVDASGCKLPVDFYFQGGMHGVKIRKSNITVPGAIQIFDAHEASEISDCTLSRDLKLTDEYGRPLAGPGDFLYCRNALAGKKIVAPGFIVTETGCTSAPTVPVPKPNAIDSLVWISSQRVYDGHIMYTKLTFRRPSGTLTAYKATLGDAGFSGQHPAPMLTAPNATAPVLKPGTANTEEFWVAIDVTMASKMHVVFVYSENAGGASGPSNPVLTLAVPEH